MHVATYFLYEHVVPFILLVATRIIFMYTGTNIGMMEVNLCVQQAW